MPAWHARMHASTHAHPDAARHDDVKLLALFALQTQRCVSKQKTMVNQAYCKRQQRKLSSQFGDLTALQPRCSRQEFYI
eukprot:6184714-Pleurochrysis_carterae.AAC.1